MSQTIGKQAPIRLEDENYGELCKQILRRDGWRCQLCGSMTNLEIHHKRFRSRSGEDNEHNLITLCHDCHASTHIPISTVQPGDFGIRFVCHSGATLLPVLWSSNAFGRPQKLVNTSMCWHTGPDMTSRKKNSPPARQLRNFSLPEMNCLDLLRCCNDSCRMKSR